MAEWKDLGNKAKNLTLAEAWGRPETWGECETEPEQRLRRGE